MLRILIADDHEIVRKGLIHILLDKFPLAYIEEAIDGTTTVKKALEGNWDIVLCDIAMPDMNGIKALQLIKAKLPQLPVLMVSIQTEEQYCKTMIRAGASGYLTKDAAPDELEAAIKEILKGNIYISPFFKYNAEAEKPSSTPHDQLSIRELEVLRLLANGKTLIEIAEVLSLSPSTISTFRARILKKLSVTNNAELTRYAFDNKLI